MRVIARSWLEFRADVVALRLDQVASKMIAVRLLTEVRGRIQYAVWSDANHRTSTKRAIGRHVLASAAKTATSFGAIEGSTPRDTVSRGVEPSIASKDVAVFAALAETPGGMRCGGRRNIIRNIIRNK